MPTAGNNNASFSLLKKAMSYEYNYIK